MKVGHRNILFAIFLVTALLRLLVWLDVHFNFSCMLHYERGLDMFVYRNWGADIAAGNLFTSHWGGEFHNFLYALFVGAVYGLFGVQTTAVPLLQLCLGATAVFPLAGVLRKYVELDIVWLTLLLYAFFAAAPFYEVLLLRDQLLGIAVIWLWYFWVEQRQLAVGLTAAVCGLLRENTLFYLPFFLVLVVRGPAPKDLKAREVARLLCGFVCAFVPFKLLGIFAIPSLPSEAASGGLRLLIRANAHTSQFGTFDIVPELDATAEAVGRSYLSFLVWMANEWLSHPVEMARLYLNKIWALYASAEAPDNVSFDLARLQLRSLRLLFVDWGWVSSLGLVGLLTAFRGGGGRRHLAIFTLLNLASILVFFAFGRYRGQVHFLFLVLASCALAWLVSLLRSGNRVKAAALAVSIGGLFLLTRTSPVSSIRPIDHFNLGRQCMLQGDLDLSRKFLSAAQTADPSIVVSHLLDAVTLEAHFLRALSRAEKSDERVALLNRLGMTTTVGKIPDRARDYFRRSLEIRPNAEAYYSLAILDHVEGRSDSAREDIKQAIEIDPGYAPARRIGRTGEFPRTFKEAWPELF